MTRKARFLAAGGISIGIAAAAVLAYALRDEVVVRHHLRKLRTGDEEERSEAVRRLGELRSERALEALLDLARSDAPESLRLEAAEAAVRAGRGAAPRIKEGLDETDAGFRRKALEAAGKIEPQPDDLLPLLCLALEDRDYWVRAESCWNIREIGPAAASCVDSLLRALRDPVVLKAAIERDDAPLGGLRSDQYYADIAAALRSIGKPAMPALLVLLGDEQAVYRRVAMDCLESMGKEDPGLAPVFEEALGHRDLSMRSRAAIALWELNPGHDGAMRVFKQLLDDQDPEARMQIAHRLGGFGPAAKDAIPRLIELARSDGDFNVREVSVNALGRMGPVAQPAVPMLLDLMENGDSRICDFAAIAIWSISGEDGRVSDLLPSAVEMLGGEKVFTRSSAVVLIDLMGERAREALPALAKALGDEDVGVRLQVLDALEKMGPEARSAIAGALKDPDAAVRKAAAGALERLDKRTRLESR